MPEQVRTARVAGAWYLGLAVTGILGFGLVRRAIYVEGDPAATLVNLQDKEALAHLGVMLEMGIVVTQALAAIWFYKLFREVRHVAGVSVAAFGLINAVAIMASAAFLSTAIAVAQDSSLAPAGDATATVGVLHQLSSNAWGIGGMFFGLWLIPMGWTAITTARFPRALGWILVIGGACYLLSSVVDYGFANPPGLVVAVLVIPATIGEFWMIGYLLLRGIRPAAVAP